MRKLVVALIAALGLVLPPGPLGAAPKADVAQLIKQIEALKARISALEAQLRQLKSTQQLPAKPVAGVKSLVSELESKITMSGSVAVVGRWRHYDRSGASSRTTSDIILRTAEVIFNITPTKNVRGLVHFLWEQDKTEPVDIDEGYIVLGGTGSQPFYLQAGRLYPPLGDYETVLISDPLTKEAFETQESAVQAGYEGSWFKAATGAYNASVAEVSDGDDDTINTYFLRVDFTPPAKKTAGVELAVGAFYTNNIADSNMLRDHVANQQLASLVAGWGVVGSASWQGLAFTGEYITAADDFANGELEFAPASATPRPWAYKLELAYSPLEAWTFAARYEATGDFYEELPERRWGGGVVWAFAEHTSLTAEYMRADYSGGTTADELRARVMVEF